MDFRSLPQYPGAPDPPPSQRERHAASNQFEDAFLQLLPVIIVVGILLLVFLAVCISVAAGAGGVYFA